ncbi:MAG: ArsC family transcriptional regulator [Clostridia bacterium]|nr:ArsC family transcriptional regulator [Clostridia bacterium]
MNIQIYGRSKCFDTKKAERFFKERRVKYQYIDLDRYGMSRGELKSVVAALGLAAIINEKNDGAATVSAYAYEEDKIDALYNDPALIKTPVVRNGRAATVGACENVWKEWMKS